MMRVAYAAVAAFVIALLLGPATIGYLRRLKFGETVRNDGPQTHLKKAACRPWAGCSLFSPTSSLLGFLPCPTGGFHTHC